MSVSVKVKIKARGSRLCGTDTKANHKHKAKESPKQEECLTSVRRSRLRDPIEMTSIGSQYRFYLQSLSCLIPCGHSEVGSWAWQAGEATRMPGGLAGVKKWGCPLCASLEYSCSHHSPCATGCPVPARALSYRAGSARLYVSLPMDPRRPGREVCWKLTRL